MNKVNLFTLLLVLLMIVEKINSAGVDHSNQKSPASVLYVDGPAPDDLKAGPSNKNTQDKKENVKHVLQQYVVTTGAPTIETVFESSSITPNLKSSSNDNISVTKYNQNDEYPATVVSIKPPVRKSNRNQKLKNAHFKSPQFERYTNDEPSQKQNSYEATTVRSEYKNEASSTYKSSINSETASSSTSGQYQTSTAYPVYKDPILIPGVHSTPLSDEHSTYNQNSKTNNENFSGVTYSDDKQTHYPSNTDRNYEARSGDENVNYDGNSHYNTNYHENGNRNFLQGQSVSTTTLQPGIALHLPGTTFNQTHHIINHQPVPNNQFDPNLHSQRFTSGHHISTPGPFYLPQPQQIPVYTHHSTPVPIYHPHPTVQHIPVVTEIPVTEVQEHHGVIEKTLNVPQHGVQTKTYEIRRPAIQKQFYDIEERVVVKPAGSVVLEIDQPISKTATGHVSTTTVKSTEVHDYSHHVSSPPPQIPHGHINIGQGHSHYLPSSPPQYIPHGGGYEGQSHSQHLPPSPPQYIPHGGGYGGHGQSHYVPLPVPQYIPQSGINEGYGYSHYSPIQPSQYVPQGGHVTTSTFKNVVSNNHYIPPQGIPHNGVVYIGGHSGTTASSSSDCNNHPISSNLHQINNVPHYSVPIGSAVTTTQTSANIEEEPIVVNVKHSEKYVDSLRKHTPIQTASLTKLETLSRIQDNRQNLSHRNFSTPQMIAKGEPDFNHPPYVQIKFHGEPVNQNYGANTLYTMQSLINNNLYNPESNEEKQLNTHSNQNNPRKLNNSPNYQNLPNTQNFANNHEQYKNPQQPIEIAQVRPISKTEFQNVQHLPRSDASAPFVVYAVSPNNQQSFQENNFKTNNVPISTVSQSSQPNSFPLNSNQNQQFRPTNANYAQNVQTQTFPDHSNLIASSTPHNKVFAQARFPERNNQYVQTTQIQTPHNYIQTPVRGNTDVSNHANYLQNSENPTSQRVVYSQVPAITYHIQNDQVPNYSTPLQTINNKQTQNLNPLGKHSERIIAPYQNLPHAIYYQGQPCDFNNPILATAPQQFPTTYLTTPTASHSSQFNNYPQGQYSTDSPQSFQKQNTQFNSASTVNQQEQLPSSFSNQQNVGTLYIPPQHYQQLPYNNNNQQNHYVPQQQSVTQSAQVSPYSDTNKHQQTNNAPQDHMQLSQPQDSAPNSFQAIGLPTTKQNNKIQSFNFQPNNVAQSNLQQNQEPNNSYENEQLHSDNNSENSNHASTKNQIQYFPPDNKFQSKDGNFNAEPSNKEYNEQNYNNAEYNQNPNFNNATNDSVLYQNNYITVKKTDEEEYITTEASQSDELKKNDFTKSPSLQIIVENQQNNDTTQSQLQDKHNEPKSKKEHKTNANYKDADTSPTHSYFQVTNNVHPGESSLSFHPLPSQSQDHILQFLLSSKGQPAQPIQTPSQPSQNNYGFDPIKTRVVSATPASKFAKAAGEKINTRRIVVNQPIETVQVVEEQEPITTYKQVTVQQPTVYKTQSHGVKRVQSSVPVLVPQQPIYPAVPFYHGQHISPSIYNDGHNSYGSHVGYSHMSYPVIHSPETLHQY